MFSLKRKASRPKVQSRKVVIFGESGVGKTCITDMLLQGTHFAYYDPAGYPLQEAQITVDDESWCLGLIDLSSSVLREQDPTFSSNVWDTALSRADGIVLLYDITDRKSYEYITKDGYMNAWVSRKAERDDGEGYLSGKQRFGCVLIGNKLDLAKENREVSSEIAEGWAESQGLSFFEMDSNDKELIEEAMKALVNSMKRAERRDSEDILTEKQRDKEGNLEKDVVNAKKKEEWRTRMGRVKQRLSGPRHQCSNNK